MKVSELEKQQNEGVEDLPSEERRKFLRFGFAVTGVFLGGSVLSLTPARASQGMITGPVPTKGQYNFAKHYTMVIRENRCVDCERCVDACNETNNVHFHTHDYYRTKILGREIVVEGEKEWQFRPILCNQCNRPPCVRVCPTNATYKDKKTGIVVMNKSKCIGCKTCMAACPYNARYFDEHVRAIDKCNFCLDTRLSRGETKTACSAACPAGVRVFGDMKDTSSEVYKLLHTPEKTVWVLRPETGALPNVFYMND